MNLGALIGLLPTLLAGVAAVFGLDTERRARRHAELLQKLPEGVDAAPLRGLLEAELQRVAETGHRRLHRKVKGATVAALVFVAVVGTLGGGWLWQTPFGAPVWLARPLSVLLSLFALALMVAGLSDLWEYPDGKPPAQKKR